MNQASPRTIAPAGRVFAGLLLFADPVVPLAAQDSAGIVSDVPAEAQLAPAFRGIWEFQ